MPHIKGFGRYGSRYCWDGSYGDDTYSGRFLSETGAWSTDEISSHWIEVVCNEGTMFVPPHRFKDFLILHPETRIVDREWERVTMGPEKHPNSWSRWELDGEPSINTDIYQLVYNEEIDNGMSKQQAHALAWRAGREAYVGADLDDLDSGDKCLVCGLPDCRGQDTCDVCGRTTHDDPTVGETGICSHCHDKMMAESDRSVWQ